MKSHGQHPSRYESNIMLAIKAFGFVILVIGFVFTIGFIAGLKLAQKRNAEVFTSQTN